MLRPEIKMPDINVLTYHPYERELVWKGLEVKIMTRLRIEYQNCGGNFMQAIKTTQSILRQMKASNMLLSPRVLEDQYGYTGREIHQHDEKFDYHAEKAGKAWLATIGAVIDNEVSDNGG